jgi:hypothetical protein
LARREVRFFTELAGQLFGGWEKGSSFFFHISLAGAACWIQRNARLALFLPLVPFILLLKQAGVGGMASGHRATRIREQVLRQPHDF